MSTRLPANAPSSAAQDIQDAAAKERASQDDSPIPRPFLILFGITGLIVALLLKPYAVPLFLAATLAVTVFPLHRTLERAMPARPTLAAAFSTLILLAVVIAPLASLAAYSASAVSEGVSWLKEHVQQQHLQELGEGKVPGPLRPLVQRSLSNINVTADDIEAYSGRLTEFLQTLTPKLASASLGVISNLIFVLFAFFFLIKEGPALSRHLFAVLPLKTSHTSRLFEDFVSVATASMIGALFTASGQAVVLATGFWVAGLPHVFFLAVLSFLAAFVPLAGATLVWLPVALIAGLSSGAKVGLAVAVWSVVSIQVVDVALKPLVLKGRMTMHGALTFLGMIGGLTLFGPVGFIAGPMCIAFFLSFLAMYERDYRDHVPT